MRKGCSHRAAFTFKNQLFTLLMRSNCVKYRVDKEEYIIIHQYVIIVHILQY